MSSLLGSAERQNALPNEKCLFCTISILSLQNKATGAESLFLATIISTIDCTLITNLMH